MTKALTYVELDIPGFNESAEATQFLSRVSLSASQRRRYGTLIDALVAAEVWTKLDALYIFATSDSATALTNLKSVNYGATAQGAPTFTTDRGYNSAGNDSYIDTNFNPNTAGGNYSQNSAHLGIWSLSGQGSLNEAVGGHESAATLTHLFPRYVDNLQYFRINDAVGAPTAGIANVTPFGFLLANRSGASAQQAYRNGSALSLTGVTSAALPNRDIVICATDANGTIQSESASQVAAVSIGGSLDAAQVASLYTALKAYMDEVAPPIYLMSNQSGTSNSLFVSSSRDGTGFDDYGVSYNPSPDPGVRDPSMVRVGDVIYAAYTNVTLITDQTSTFSYAKSLDDGETWTRIGSVSCANLAGGSGRVWAPEFYTHDDGSIYVLFSYSTVTTTPGNFQLGAIQALDLAGNSWGTAAQITGSAIPADAIDPFIVRRGSTYYLWYKDETSKFVEIASSSSAFSGYNTAFEVDDWAGWGSDTEAPHLIYLGGSSWRVYVDKYVSTGVMSAVSTDDWATWSTLRRVAQSAINSTSVNNASFLTEIPVAATTSASDEPYRFAMTDCGYLPHDIDVTAADIDSIDHKPSLISLGRDMGTRASVTVTFRDHKHAWQTDGSDLTNGTIWGKFRARYGLKLRGYDLRVICGELGQTIEEMETRHFIIESTNGPANDGKFQIIAKDVLKFADGDRAQAPLLSNGFLQADVTNVATTLTLSPTGVGAEYPSGSPTNFYINVGGKEIMLVTNRASDVLTVTRAQFNTTAVAHEDGDRVQACLEFTPQNAASIMALLLVSHAGIDSSYVDFTAWNAEVNAFLGVNYSALIAEPTDVSKLVAELIEQAGLVLWWDDLAQQIRLQVLRSIATTAFTYTGDIILEKSLSVKEQPEKRISQVYTYFGKINPLIREDEIANYRSTASTIDEAAEAEYGSAAIKKIFSRWIPIGGRTVADTLNAIQLARYRDPPRQITFDVFRDVGSNPLLGNGYQLQSWLFQDQDGNPATVPIQVTSVKPGPAVFEVEAEEMLFDLEFSPGSPDVRAIIIDGSVNDVNLRTMHDSIYTSAPTSGMTINITINAGVIVGASSTVTPACTVGTWPGGVTLNLAVNGRIQGCGGAGASGGAATFTESVGGGTGNTGGTALYSRTAINLSGSGGVWGGGGSGGGGAGVHTGSAGYGGGGGSGGAGTAGGAAGFGGFGSTQSGANGLAGTATAGGASNPSVVADGGAGGGPGLVGSAGQNTGTAPGGAGGAAGYAIDGDSFVTGTASDMRGPTIN